MNGHPFSGGHHLVVSSYLHSYIASGDIDQNAKFLQPLIFKNGFVGDIAFSRKEEMFLKNPLALF